MNSNSTQNDHHINHCDNCFNPKTCRSNFICELIECPNKCGQTFHECKRAEHLEHTCPNSLVKCINHSNGCKLSMKRSQLTAHLVSCVASVVQCFHSYSTDDDSTRLNTKIPDSDTKFDPVVAKNKSSKRSCHELVRRDEFFDHYALVHNFLIPHLDVIFQTCPYSSSGCNVFSNRVNFLFVDLFDLSESNWRDHHSNAELTYDESSNSFGFSFSNLEKQIGEFGTGLGLIDLPIEVQGLIMKHLDSASFLSLSLVSKVN
jgi:hypothetical protein